MVYVFGFFRCRLDTLFIRNMGYLWESNKFTVGTSYLCSIKFDSAQFSVVCRGFSRQENHCYGQEASCFYFFRACLGSAFLFPCNCKSAPVCWRRAISTSLWTVSSYIYPLFFILFRIWFFYSRQKMEKKPRAQQTPNPTPFFRDVPFLRWRDNH